MRAIRRSLGQLPRSTTVSRKFSVFMQTFRSFSAAASVSDDEENRNIDILLENNRKWVEDIKSNNPDYFKNLSETTKAKYLYIGCADSRIPSSQVLGLKLGEAYVHRNVGNLIPGNDLNALSVLEYAIGRHDVTDIIVAVRAAMSRQDLGTLEHWLRQIRDVYRLHKDHLDLISNDETRHNRLVELNVVEQCLNLFKTGVVQRRRMQSKNDLVKKSIEQGKGGTVNANEIHPRIHGCIFNHTDGKIRTLRVDFKKRVGSLDHIYGLYGRDAIHTTDSK